MAAGGAIAGLAAAVGAAWFTARPEPPAIGAPAMVKSAEVPRPTPAAAPQVLVVAPDSSTVSALVTSAPPGAGGVATAVATPASLEEQRKAQFAVETERMRDRVKSHDGTRREPDWAVRTESAVQAQFQKVRSAIAVDLDNVECRSVSCVAHFRWSDWGTSEQKLSAIAVELGQVAPKAIRHVTLNTMEGGEATAVLDWTDSNGSIDNKEK